MWKVVSPFRPKVSALEGHRPQSRARIRYPLRSTAVHCGHLIRRLRDVSPGHQTRSPKKRLEHFVKEFQIQENFQLLGE